MMPSLSLTLLVLVGVGSPTVLLAVLGCASLLNRPLPERWTGRIAAGSMMTACASLSVALVVYGVTGTGQQLVSYGALSTSIVAQKLAASAVTKYEFTQPLAATVRE